MVLPVKMPYSSKPEAETEYRIKTENLSYKISPKYHRIRSCFFWELNHDLNSKQILRNVNCEAKPGEITAIAGPSGAGKTTLLEILAGMVPHRGLTGFVLVNDQPMDPSTFRRVSGYVTQEDALFPLLTVEETLMYSALLRLHKGGRNAALTRVKELLLELGLEHVASERIGSELSRGRGISGGEKRRVSIGVDLVHDPRVLLMDEPTSGLDSAAALHVMMLLKKMAKNRGKTIVLTIHQPGFRILELFDQVVLLFDGTVIHHGPLYLLEERLKYAGHCIPRQVNVLEFAIDAANTLLTDEEENIIDVSAAKQRFQHHIRTEEDHMVYPNYLVKEVLILGQRFAYNIFRTKELFVAKMLQALVIGLLLGTIFMDVKRYNMQTQIGFFAFNLTFLLYSTTEAMPIFLQERKILMRETLRGAYRVASYTIANSIVFLPFLLIVAFLYATPVYWLVGLRGDIGAFLYFSLVVWLVLLMSNSFVVFFSALVPSFIMGISLVAGLMGSFFLFSGYFISNDDIPKYWIFMHYLSLFRYPFECFMMNEFGGEQGKWRCLERIEGECIVNGEAFLRKQNLEASQKWSNLVVMLCFVIGYRVLSVLVLLYRSQT